MKGHVVSLTKKQSVSEKLSCISKD